MRKTLHLEKTIYGQNDLTVPEAPQIALAGRSNVGKSSLLNRLAGRKQLAKTSSTPGKTQSINLYRVDPSGYYLVDLPGYGYARRSKEERARWAKLIERYLTGNERLQGVAVLIDCRLPPQQSDLDMVGWLRAEGVPVLGVLTKADKCTQRDRQAQKARWAALLGGQAPVLFSSVSGMGFEELWRLFDQAVGLADTESAAPAQRQETAQDA
ncbi:putative GTP-binding protein EngB [Fundidesulfovibrio magnetotacticus]|uniref:Probable GTP-binding protein EngB n=1 Tax=Fundidesulfovibrio magnetotacticus TaxID=2730080 RepID=A0A6V8LPP5_9BACT|nr:ribosome biogenesis GTP-binding protein YihA/YsxC [Fundidesulfovibrio magnetotacticus]GFK94532.1 putative GTP-binding protein EngB [Fundidesulfovibrio magnetotacticus]